MLLCVFVVSWQRRQTRAPVRYETKRGICRRVVERQDAKAVRRNQNVVVVAINTLLMLNLKAETRRCGTAYGVFLRSVPKYPKYVPPPIRRNISRYEHSSVAFV